VIVGLNLQKNTCLIQRADDVKIYRESLLWHRIKRVLQRQGYDVVKKLMWKDGYLVSDDQYYIRQRKWEWAITDSHYAIRSLCVAYNAGEPIVLTVHQGENW